MKQTMLSLAGAVFVLAVVEIFVWMTGETTPSKQTVSTTSVGYESAITHSSSIPVGPKTATIIEKVVADKKGQLVNGKR